MGWGSLKEIILTVFQQRPLRPIWAGNSVPGGARRVPHREIQGITGEEDTKTIVFYDILKESQGRYRGLQGGRNTKAIIY